jgi:hypothetical protein
LLKEKSVKKIENMTGEQTAKMLEFREAWRAIGLDSSPANVEAIRPIINRFYDKIGKKAPYIWRCESPLTAHLVIHFLKKSGFDRANLRANLGDNLWANLGDNLGANLWANLRDNLGANLRANLRDNLRDNLGANLRDNLGDNLGANLWANLGANLGANLWANLGANLRANLRDNLGDNLSWGFWGSHESAWPAYYNFPDAELRKMFSDEQREKLHLWLSVCAGTGWWEPYENVVFMCERPSVQIVNSGGRLHCETGPAILCRDGWPVYALNGVRMKPEHVLTPAEKLDPTECLKETNADIRRELIRKMGVESMLAHLPHKVLDTQGDYSLLKIDFPGLVQDTRFLKMLNPSIGVWHVEGIERSCNTVEQAINWRAAGAFGETVKWNPAQLT